MARIKRIVTSEVEGRNLSDFYGDNSYSIESDGTINYYGENKMGPVIEPGIVYGSNADSGDGYGYNTIKLVPHAPEGDINDDRYLIVDPTTPNHIHIRAGGTQDASNAELILGGEKANVKVVDSGHNVSVNTHDSGTDSYYSWTFGNDGIFYGPAEGAVQFYGAYSPGTMSIVSDGNMTITSNTGNMNLYMDGGLYIGNTASENQILKRSDLNNIPVKTLVPTTAGDSGTTGQVAWDTNYFYVCVAENTWKRVALSTW